MTENSDLSLAKKNSSHLSAVNLQKKNFGNFCLPNVNNIKIHRLYIKKQYQKCRNIIEDILKQYDESLCEDQIIFMAKISREEAKLSESLFWLKKAQNFNLKSNYLLYEIGKGYYLLGEHKKAIEFFQNALEQGSKDWKVYYWQSLTYYHVIQPPLCIQKAQKILISCPYLKKSADILLFLAKLLTEQNDVNSAVEAYKQSIQLEPENVDLIHSLGMLYLKTQNEENAFLTLGKVLTIDPTYVPSVLALTSILQSRGNHKFALNKYRTTAKNFDHSCALWNNIGMCYYGKGKLISAISCLNKANYLCPLDWKVLYNLSLCYLSMQQFASAYHFISSAFALCPQNPLILMMIAITLTELGDFFNAKAAYKRAFGLNNELFVVRLNFAIFEYRRGNILASIRRMGNKLKLDFNKSNEEINLLANQLKSCYEKLTNNLEVENLLKKIYANEYEEINTDNSDNES